MDLFDKFDPSKNYTIPVTNTDFYDLKNIGGSPGMFKIAFNKGPINRAGI
jgi:hypothetical protein